MKLYNIYAVFSFRKGGPTMMIRHNGHIREQQVYKSVLIEVRIERNDPQDSEALVLAAFTRLGARASNVEVRPRQWSPRPDIIGHVKTMHSLPDAICDYVKEIIE